MDGGGAEPRPAAPAGRTAANLQAEWLAALRGLELEDALLLAQHGLNLPLLVDLGLQAHACMVGALAVHVDGRRWWPDPAGDRGFVTPVRTRGDACDPLADEIVISGPLIDLILWHPATPRRWATRTGAAEALGLWDPGLAHERTVRVRVWRAPFAWLRGWMEGVVPLTHDRHELYRLLIDMPAIRAEDEAHKLQLERALLWRPYPLPVVDWPKAT
jgi:hypothetical protein